MQLHIELRQTKLIVPYQKFDDGHYWTGSVFFDRWKGADWKVRMFWLKVCCVVFLFIFNAHLELL